MMEANYFPLIDMDNDGCEKQAMFPAGVEKTLRSTHRFWLAEAVPGCFRLRSGEKVSTKEVAKFHIHCPRCGEVMKAITPTVNSNLLPLYLCKDCRRSP